MRSAFTVRSVGQTGSTVTADDKLGVCTVRYGRIGDLKLGNAGEFDLRAALLFLGRFFHVGI